MIKPNSFASGNPPAPWDLPFEILDRVVFNHHEDQTADKKLEPGDVLSVSRWGNLYEHYGVYIGQNQVIHFAGEPGDSELLDDSAMVRTVSLSDFKQDSEYRIIAFPKESSISCYHLYSAEETVERAKSRLGERGYGPWGNNCEHFAYWCKTGVKRSKQVEALKKVLKKTLGLETEERRFPSPWIVN